MENRPVAPVLSTFLLVAFVFVISAKVMNFAFSRSDSARGPASFTTHAEDRGTALKPADFDSVLSDRNLFSKTIQHWRVECFDHPILKTDQFFGVRFKDFAEDTLYSGLVKLRQLNPSAVRQVMSRIQIPLILDCKDFDRDSGLLANLLGKPRVVGRFLQIQGAAEAVACGFGAYCHNDPKPVDGLRNPMFQELLQVYGVDNVKHEKIAAENVPGRLVSACAATIYPSAYYPVGVGLLPSGARVDRLASEEACRVCVNTPAKTRKKNPDFDRLQSAIVADQVCPGMQLLVPPVGPAA